MRASFPLHVFLDKSEVSFLILIGKGIWLKEKLIGTFWFTQHEHTNVCQVKVVKVNLVLVCNRFNPFTPKL